MTVLEDVHSGKEEQNLFHIQGTCSSNVSTSHWYDSLAFVRFHRSKKNVPAKKKHAYEHRTDTTIYRQKQSNKQSVRF